MASPEPLPRLNFPQDTAFGRGFIKIRHGDKTWRALSKSVNWINKRFNPEQGGFSSTAINSDVSLASTYMGLDMLWWSEYGIHIDDATSRFEKAHTKKAYEAITSFVASQFRVSVEQNGDRQIPVAGFVDEKEGVTEIRSSTTHMALETLWTLEQSLRKHNAIAYLEQRYSFAFGDILNFIENRWMESKQGSGGFADKPDQPVPDIWGTHAALETIKLITSQQTDQNSSQAAFWVWKIREHTPAIIELLKSYQDLSGGYGFLPNSHPNILSTNQAVQIVRALFYFNYPTQYQNESSWREYMAENLSPLWRIRVIDFIESLRVPGDIVYYGVRHRRSPTIPLENLGFSPVK